MSHVIHCLGILRDDVICHAGDKPRYTITTQKSESGIGPFGNAAIGASWRDGRQSLRTFGGIRAPRMTRVVKLGGGMMCRRFSVAQSAQDVDGEA